MISQAGVPGPMKLKPASRAAAPSALHISSLPKPNRLSICDIIQRENRAPMLTMKVSEPEAIGLMPKPSCSISGSRKGTPLMAIRQSPPASVPTAKERRRNKVRSITGAATVRA